MPEKKNILIINGSASKNSSNERLIEKLIGLIGANFNCSTFHQLKNLPHFDPELSVQNTPSAVLKFRENIQNADAVVICTPEYIFSIPSGLKNAIEWCVSTTVFSNKTCGLITASAHGQKGHEELHLIMSTLMARLNPHTNLLIQGIKGKINQQGDILDEKTLTDLNNFAEAFRTLLEK